MTDKLKINKFPILHSGFEGNGLKKIEKKSILTSLNFSAYFKHQPIFVSFAVIIFIQVVGTWIITAAYVYIPGFFKNLNENEIPLVYYGINCLSSLLTTIQFWGIYLTR
jgi:hypothetical protein